VTHSATTHEHDQVSKDRSDSVFFAAVVPKAEYDSFACYWLLVDGINPEENNSPAKLTIALREILTDPLLEDLWFDSLSDATKWGKVWQEAGYVQWAEKQFLPGVTDNLAHIVEEALQMKDLPFNVKVASGRIYLAKKRNAFENTEYTIFHPLVERFVVHDLGSASGKQDALTFPSVTLARPSAPSEVDLSGSDSQLEAISRERLLALSLAEMQTIRNYFDSDSMKKIRRKAGLPSAPTDVELEIIAQTWSEHCKHKIFNARIEHIDYRADSTGKRTQVNSLYKSYVQAATNKLRPKRPDLLSVFVDNSGVVQWDENWAVCFKVETHNSPSALEPYGGALTGILGVNRDVLGTGLGARPLFNTDILCFAYPSEDLPKRPKLLPAATIMSGVRKGIQDGGNKSGIPTVNGAIVFDRAYRAKPLVFCGTGGILPLKVNGASGFAKHTKPGDVIVMAGGRVGKDGVHGATFSSEALHEGSPVTAVQIGDPFTQKRLLDFVLEARDLGLISGITDNGAGGLSSSVGEMAQLTGGATIELDYVPTKYPGLADWELVVSESQERMTISTSNYEKLKELALKHHVEVSAIGHFNTSGSFEVTRSGRVIAALDLAFLHDGVPLLELTAETRPTPIKENVGEIPPDLSKILLTLLAHPNLSNRESVIRQYDHEVQGSSVIKPLMGARQKAACDAAVITPVLGSQSGLSVSNGICPRLSKYDSHLMSICAVDEAIRNAVCVGADPESISLLDNFCWPDPVEGSNNKQGKAFLGMLVMACKGLYEAATAFEAPLISGKDSMKNDFDDGTIRLSIPPTLLISAIGKVPDIDKCVSMEFKQPGDLIYLLSAGTPGLAGSHYEEIMDWRSDLLCSIDLPRAKKLYAELHKAMQNGWVRSAHDLSEGGLAAALAECIIGSGKGAAISLSSESSSPAALRQDFLLFGEGPARILVSIDPRDRSKFETAIDKGSWTFLGEVTTTPELKINGDRKQKSPLLQVSLENLEQAWNRELPFD
jgi:phosphoribosylformylglycinamidine synthase